MSIKHIVKEITDFKAFQEIIKSDYKKELKLKDTSNKIKQIINDASMFIKRIVIYDDKKAVYIWYNDGNLKETIYRFVLREETIEKLIKEA